MNAQQIKDETPIFEATKQPRIGWFESYHPDYNETVSDAIPADEGGDEWVWQTAAKFTEPA